LKITFVAARRSEFRLQTGFWGFSPAARLKAQEARVNAEFPTPGCDKLGFFERSF
jgi:hypothetical protein